MMRAGNIPAVIEDFARGYLPTFSPNIKSIEAYHGSLIATVSKLLSRGLMKDYIQISPPPSWRGRLLVSDTVRTEIAHGIKFRKAFDFKSLSTDIAANRALKFALTGVLEWLRSASDKRVRQKIPNVLAQLRQFDGVLSMHPSETALIASIPRITRTLPRQYRYYADALWAAYVILQGRLPDPSQYGYISLDSMIVDVSAVFEGYIRRVLEDHAIQTGIRVKDGNDVANRPFFFSDQPQEDGMKPDIIVERSGSVAAIIDVKYKRSVNEHDRYELLSFMEATGAKEGAFVCPKIDLNSASTRLGSTLGGRRMSIIRFDLSAPDIAAEESKLVKSVLRVLDGGIP